MRGGSFSLGLSLASVRHRPGFSALALFAAGEQGLWLDPSDLTTMFQDAAGTTPAVVGQPVGLILDKSGRGNHASQATTAQKPVLQQDGSGNYYLAFDGVDDSLATAAIDFTGTDEMSVFAGVRKIGTSTQHIVGTNDATTLGAGTFYLRGISGNYQFGVAAASGSYGPTFSGADAPTTNVLSTISDFGAPQTFVRQDGVEAAASVGPSGGGAFANRPIFIGRRDGNTLPFNGRIYSLIVRGALTADDVLTKTEAYVAGKTGVIL